MTDNRNKKEISMENLSKAIKLLAQHISLDSLSTKDLILELTNLCAKVEKLEQELEQYRYKKDDSAHSNTRKDLAKYMAEFIVPTILSKTRK